MKKLRLLLLLVIVALASSPASASHCPGSSSTCEYNYIDGCCIAWYAAPGYSCFTYCP